VRYRLDGGEVEEFGYGPDVPIVYNPGVLWDDPAASAPISDLKEVRSQIIKSTGMAARHPGHERCRSRRLHSFERGWLERLEEDEDA
jgi:hypothetical protein